MQATIIIHISGPAATSLSFNALSGPFRVPVAVATVFGQMVVLPDNWTGNLSVSGPDAAFIGVDANLQIVAVAPITAPRDYTITVTAAE